MRFRACNLCFVEFKRKKENFSCYFESVRIRKESSSFHFLCALMPACLSVCLSEFGSFDIHSHQERLDETDSLRCQINIAMPAAVMTLNLVEGEVLRNAVL